MSDQPQTCHFDSHVLSTSLGPTTQHVQHMKQVDLSSHSASHYHKI